MKNRILICVLSLFTNTFVLASNLPAESIFEELNPRLENIDQMLLNLDRAYEVQTGRSATLEEPTSIASNCRREKCHVWVRIERAEQLFYVYLDGVLTYNWVTSTGKAETETPKMDTHPTGRIYDAYDSKVYPGGDYNHLGNMPYAFFVKGGYAIHGTTENHWNELGQPVSGGCIRLHPDNALILNQLVRRYGRRGVWITVN